MPPPRVHVRCVRRSLRSRLTLDAFRRRAGSAVRLRSGPIEPATYCRAERTLPYGDMHMTTWFITGCSTGIGRHLAEAVLERGYNAVVTARGLGAVQDLAESYPKHGPAAFAGCDRPKPGRHRDTRRRGPVRGHRRAGEQRGLRLQGGGRGGRGGCGGAALRHQPLRPHRDDQGGAARHARATPWRDRQHLLDRRPHLPAGLGILLGLEVRAGSDVGVVARGAGAPRHHGDRGRARRLSNRLRRPFAATGQRPIADYADTAGRRRKEHDTAHGTQPGDPSRGAQAIITAVEADDPPSFSFSERTPATPSRRCSTRKARNSRSGGNSA